MAKTKEKKEKKEKKVKVTTADVSMTDAPAAASAPATESNTTVKPSADEVDDYEARLGTLCAIAKPLAPKKLNKKILKTVKKASKAKHVKRGVKEVVKALRKKEAGLVIIAGDISPIDVISHLPVLCEDNSTPYMFVVSKEQLGAAGGTKRPTSVVMVQPGGKKKDMSAAKEYKDAFDEIVAECSKAA
ncbi:snoRNA-binding protein [Savitreella phatthalungensis]